MLPAFIRQDSNTPDVSQDRAIQWMAPISGTKAVFTYNQGGMLYQFDSSLATANSVPASAFTSLKWIGPSYIGAALGNNRVFWYQRAGGAIGHQGCDAADTTLPPTCQDYHLMSVSLDSSTGYAITDHGLIVDQLGRTVWRTPSMATDGTNENVFLVGDWWTYDTSGNPIPGDHGVNNTLRYHYDGAAWNRTLMSLAASFLPWRIPRRRLDRFPSRLPRSRSARVRRSSLRRRSTIRPISP